MAKFDPKYHLEDICPPDLFERLQATYHNPEHYNHTLARTLQELCNLVLVGGHIFKDGLIFVKETSRDKFLSTNRACVTGGYYGQNIKDRYLRIEGVTTMALQGFLVARPGTITGISAKSRSTGAWDLEIRKNGSPITLVSTTITSGSGSDMNIDIDVDAGDYLQFYAAGSSIDHPIAMFELAYRPT